MSKKFDWKDLALVLVAVLIGGAGWTQDSQMTIITSIALGVTWLLGFILKRFNLEIGKAVLTAALFVISLLLAVIFNPVSLPLWPVWTGDASTWLPLLLPYLSAWVTLAGPIVAAATIIYNILLAKVLEKVSTGLDRILDK